MFVCLFVYVVEGKNEPRKCFDREAAVRVPSTRFVLVSRTVLVRSYIELGGGKGGGVKSLRTPGIHIWIPIYFIFH